MQEANLVGLEVDDDFLLIAEISFNHPLDFLQKDRISTVVHHLRQVPRHVRRVERLRQPQVIALGDQELHENSRISNRKRIHQRLESVKVCLCQTFLGDLHICQEWLIIWQGKVLKRNLLKIAVNLFQDGNDALRQLIF